eukprot:5256759-Lingulodinium_polyedra.AAC.1
MVAMPEYCSVVGRGCGADVDPACAPGASGVAPALLLYADGSAAGPRKCKRKAVLPPAGPRAKRHAVSDRPG